MKTISSRFLKGAVAIILAFVMLFGTTLTGFAAVIENVETSADVDIAVSGANTTVSDGNYRLYFKFSGGSTWWNNSGCYHYAWVWGTNMTDQWCPIYKVGTTSTASTGNTTDVFYMNVPSGTLTGMKLIRSESASGDWNGYYNATGDITLPNNLSTYNMITAVTANSTSVTQTSRYTSVSVATKSATVTNADGGTGTSSDPYIVTPGQVMNVSATSTIDDHNFKVGYGYNSSSQYTTTSTGTVTANSTEGTYSFKVYYTPLLGGSTSYRGTQSSTTVYYKVVQPGFSYTVTAGEGGTASPASGTATSVEITATPDTGYDFAGWEVTGNGSVADPDAATTTLTINANGVVANATFTKIPYTVRFLGADGSVLKTDTLYYGDTPTAPTAPTITGKTFAGWTPTVSNVTGSVDYTAKYTDNTYSITVKQNGGTGTVNLGKTSAKYQDSVTLSVTPPDGYKISSITGGGLNVGECDSYNGSFTMPASNVTITVNYGVAGSCAPHFEYGDQSLVLGATFTNRASTNEFCEGNFTYSSSDTTVAEVDTSTGLVTAKKPGSTTITANCDCGAYATYTVTVKSPSVTVPAITLDVNGTYTAAPSITDGPSSGATITYSSTSVYFTVTTNGIVTALRPGTGTVNYTMTYGGNTVATGSFTVTVNTPVFTINPLSENLIVGQTMTDAFVTSSTPAATVTLSSNATGVATISGNKATAVGKGTATITASFKFNDSYTATATATVIVAAPSITANPTSVALETGEGATNTSKTVTLDTNAAAGNGTGDAITVTSENTNVATATLSGNTVTITATGVGSTKVKATFHGTTVEIPVTVTKYDPYFTVYFTNNKYSTDPYIYYWNDGGSGTFKSMVYLGKNGDGQKIFAYRFAKGSEPDNLIFTNQNGWNGSKTNDIDLDTLTTTADYVAIYLDGSSSPYTGKDWTKDFILGMSTIEISDVVVPVGSNVQTSATVSDNSKVIWSVADTTKATVTNSTSTTNADTQTTTVTGVAPGETTITARVFIDNTISSIKTLPGDISTNSASYDYISTTATATVTVGSVDYNITAATKYSNNGADYTDGTTGGTVSITVDGAVIGTSASIAHGKEYTLTATSNENYRFVGWYNGDELVDTDVSYTTTAKAAVDYTAKFVRTVKVSVEIGEGIELIKFNNVSYNESFSNVTVDAGASITVYASPAVNYNFKDWTVEGTTVADNTTVTLIITDIQSSITLTANAEPVYTATATAQTNKYFGTYGGTVTIDGKASPVQYLNGQTVTFEAHKNANYYFDGWYSDVEFTNKVSSDENYQTTMTEDGITLYGLFVKKFYLTTSADVQVAEFVYDIAKNEYTVTSEFLDHFTLTSNDNNDVTSADVNVTGGNHTGCTVAGHYTSYQVTPDTENYDIESPVTYTLTPDIGSNGSADGTYTLNIALSDAEKVNISVNGTKVAEKAIGATFSYEISAPDGQYLDSVATNPSVEATIEGNTVTFTVPNQDINIVPTFADYSYVEFTDTTGLTITGLKSGYRAGEAVEITVAAASEQVSIVNLVADNDAAVLTNNGGTWTITIAAMPADTTITFTTEVDAKFMMDYGMAAIGNYGSGYTTYGTVSMAIDGTALSKGGYADKTETVTYTATPNTNFIFDGWYSNQACELSNLLSRETSYDVTPTEDTTIYALFVPKHYLAEDQANVSVHTAMTYDAKTRSFRLSTSTIAKGAWFRVSNNPTTSYWTDSSSYCIFDNSFNVTFNDNAYLVTVGWGTQCYALTSDSSAEHPYEIIVTLNGNSSIDVSCQAARTGGGSIFLSSGRLDLPGSYNSAVFEANISYTHEGVTNPADVYVANEGENREKYKRLSIAEPQTVSFEVEITGTAAANYYIDKFVVYHILTETYTIIDPNTLGNNKYNGSVYVDGDCYIVPIYFVDPDYAEANNLSQIDIYFDASAIKDQAWGPFVACYSWGTNNVEYSGGWSGQMMIPTEDGLSFYTVLTVPSTTNITAGSKPNGVTFNNYTQSTVPGSNPGAFGISATQYQCYDYREPITLFEAGYEVITFVAKDSTDGYHGDRANGVTANTVTSSTTDIFNKYDFNYLYNRDGNPMDLNGDEIENPVDITTSRADYYIISKGDITYDPNGTKYEADNNFDADWAVDWYVFDSTGQYITNILSDAMYMNTSATAEEKTASLLLDKIGITRAQAAGKTVAISYEHENNAGHQVSYDGQWYGNMLDHTVHGEVLVGLDNGTTFDIDTDNIADYGEAYILDDEGGKQQAFDVSMESGVAHLTAAAKGNYRFMGWYTKQPDGTYKLNKNAYNYDPYINMPTTYYAIFREITSGEFVVNHSKYNNSDPAIPDHGGVAEMYVVVTNNNTGEQVTSVPSIDLSSAAISASDGDTLTIEIHTTPLMNGEFYAWYTDSFKADGTKTYEEVFTEEGNVGSTSKVVATFDYVYDSSYADFQNYINIYSDVMRVSNYAKLRFQYTNRFGETRYYVVDDILLTDEECNGYKGNLSTPYTPTFLTLYTLLTPDMTLAEPAYYTAAELKVKLDAGYTIYKSENNIAKYAPNNEVTEVYDGIVLWDIVDTQITAEKSIVTIKAVQDDPTYTVNYKMGDQQGSIPGVYNTLIDDLIAPATYKGAKFSYWKNSDTNEILTYTLHYNFRITENKNIEAVYGATDTPDWAPSIESVTYTREFSDAGDYIYTDYLLSFASKDGTEIEKLKESGADVKYGMLVFREQSYWYDGNGSIEYPGISTGLRSKFDTILSKAKNLVVNADDKKYNCYYYDITNKTTLTNFNRTDYYLQYDNNLKVDTDHYFREYAFTAVAFLQVDGVTYYSAPKDVNFYGLGITSTTN